LLSRTFPQHLFEGLDGLTCPADVLVFEGFDCDPLG